MKSKSNPFLCRSLRASFSALSLCAVAVLASCGSPSGEHPSPESTVEVWRDEAASKRFSDAEIASVYSNDAKVVDGKSMPVSKPPVKKIYSKTNAPDAFRSEHGVFTTGVEVKAYLNLGTSPDAAAISRFVAALEKVSSWKGIRNPEGKPVFDDAYVIDANGDKTSDGSDANATREGEKRRASLYVPTNTIAGNMRVPAELVLHQDDGVLQLDVRNEADCRVPLVGTVIDTNGLRIALKAFPHENGWLIYVSGTALMKKLEDQLKPEIIAGMIEGMVTWLGGQVVRPL